MMSQTARLTMFHPELRNQIEELVDLGWIVSVWALKECTLKQNDAQAVEWNLTFTEGRNRHIELLQVYLSSAAEDITRWTKRSLIVELDAAISNIKEYSRVKEHSLPLEFHSIVTRYDDIAQRAAAIDTEIPLDAAAYLLNMADACFDAMVELEHISYSGSEENGGQ
jgi:hypothetical protein